MRKKEKGREREGGEREVRQDVHVHVKKNIREEEKKGEGQGGKKMIEEGDRKIPIL